MLDWAINGFWDYSIADALVYLLVVTHITIVSVTVYLHRYSAHRSLVLGPAISHFFRFWLWLTTGQVTQEWTAIHRKHHAECETSEDPHSPVTQGLPRILWNGVEVYKNAIADGETLSRYGKGCPQDWLEHNLYCRNSWGIILMLVLDLFLFGVLGLTVWAVQMVWIPFFAAGIINGVGHFLGYRNFESPDASRNILPWGILIGGEELHNNHHTYPNSAKLSRKKHEVDIGWLWIWVFCKLGLARVVAKGPVVRRVQVKQKLDAESVWALFNDRFSVMARFAEEVVVPVVEAEYQKADKTGRKLLKKAAKLLTADEALLDKNKKIRIARLLESNHQIKKIHELKIELEAIWQQRGKDVTEVLSHLRRWVDNAESAQLLVLDDFVTTLKTYSMPSHRAIQA
ncbi:fatty acid desaturase [Gammaproteobacteria bacterium]|nr:fatty acid desaturase [Gammaproteobacteria bacterium]